MTCPCVTACTVLTIPSATVYQTTVPGQAPSTAFRVFARNARVTGNPFSGCCQTQTSLAIANPSATPAVVTMRLSPANVTATVTVPARSERLTATPILNAELPFGSDVGSLRVLSSSPVAVVALQRFNDQADGVLAIEMFDDYRTVSGQPIFPHLAVGGGYRLSLQLVNASDNPASSGIVSFFSADGSPLDPTTVGFSR
jgi:hypothetical protein